MFRFSLPCLICYLDSLIFSAALNEIEIQQAADHSKHPYKHFGQHHEYVYETPSSPDQKPGFRLSYGSIGDGSNMTGTIGQIGSLKNHKPKKHSQSNAQKTQFLDVEAENFQRHSENPNIRNFPQKVSEVYVKKAWKESENARKRAQAEYEIVRQLADDIFDQAQVLLFIVFFKILSAAADVLTPPSPENSFFGSGMNPKQYRKRRMTKNARRKMRSDAEERKDITEKRWTRNGFLKQPHDASYQLFGTLPKFDPRFPFDRAYKLMEGLRPSEILKLPSTNFHI
uniref:Uncharacterized protein n=1 Tax=Elaeophora elaphi TaxID=1147741 RepID=A0A0R3S080_9BILA